MFLAFSRFIESAPHGRNLEGAAPVKATVKTTAGSAASAASASGTLSKDRVDHSEWLPLQEFAAINDGRKFAVIAWEHPSRGGRYYAAKVVGGCAIVKNFTDGLDTVQPDISIVGEHNYLLASKALSKLQARCGQFSTNELEQYSTDVGAKDGQDKLFAIAGKFSRAVHEGSSRRTEAVRELLETRDPLLLDGVGIRLLTHEELRAYYFDGQLVPYSEAENDLVAAMYLAPCILGLPCDSTDQQLLISCSTGAGCFDSRADQIRQTITEGDKRMPQILSLAGRIAAAMQAADVDKFTFRSQ